MSKKIAILGTAPSSLNLAPVNAPDWEIWACSPGCMLVPKIDVYFELHRYLPDGVSFPLDYCAFLKTFKGKVWMTEKIDEIPSSKKFPWEKLVKKYGPYFFTSSIAWMMAEAIEAGATEIGLYGIDMAHSSEYKDQKLGCQYFATLAVAQGIKVSVPPESDLFRPNPLYGVCQNSHEWIKYTAKLIEFNEKLAEARAEVKSATIESGAWQLALESLDWYGKTWAGDMTSKDYTSPPPMPGLKDLYER